MRKLITLVVSLFVSLPVLAVPKAWTGAVSGSWSNAQNWSPQSVPAVGESLAFPAGAPNSTMTNDLIGLSVGPMTFNGPYTLNGNELTLTGDVAIAFAYPDSLICNLPLKLGASVHAGSPFSQLTSSTYNGAINVNGQTLTITSYSTTIGPLNGSGTVALIGQASGQFKITGDGLFSGAIIADGAFVEVLGSIPGANVTLNSYSLTGTGTTGMVTLNGGELSPGVHPLFSGVGATGVLHTKSVSMSASSKYGVRLAPGGVSDAIQVTGTVTLGGTFDISLFSGSPTLGQTFTIIDNDGTDAVNGQFTGLSEGSEFALGSSLMTISYRGGDGNDVVLTTVHAVKAWTGAVSGNWSNAQNWSPQSVPAVGESLAFPAGAPNSTMTNDLIGLSVGPMTFNGPYTLNGNELTLTGDVAIAFAYPDSLICNLPLKLGASVHAGAPFSQLTSSTYNGAINVNGQTLTITSYSTTIGSLNGSGTVALIGQASGQFKITGDGLFSGAIIADGVSVEVEGSIPGANVTLNSYSLTGTGTTGMVTVNGGELSPGVHPLFFGVGATGVLHTKSVSMSASSKYGVRLAPGGVSDAIQVTGTVTLGGTFDISLFSGSPTLGQTFTIIDNDGTDAVNGQFTGLSEGSEFALGSSLMTISYRGGDGNDVVLTTVHAVKAWTGAVSGNWSNAQNWSPQSVPAVGESLAFPAGAPNSTMTNDLIGLSVGPMTFNGPYTLNGNELTLTGDVAIAFAYPDSLICNLPLKLGASVHAGSPFSQLTSSTYNGAINVNGQTLTITSYSTTIGSLNGSGTVALIGQASGQFKITGDGLFSGAIIADGAFVEVLGSIPGANVTLNSYSLTGTGTTGMVTVNGGELSPGVHPLFSGNGATGVLHTKSVSMSASSTYGVRLAPGGVSDAIQVTGTVTLGGTLDVSLFSGSPAPGQTFTIIDNDGTDAINGQFTGLSESSNLVVGVYPMRISYRGGDGNDVILATLAETSAVLTQGAGTTTYGEQWMLTATVTSAFGVPTGFVSFTADGASLGSAPLVNGVASLMVSIANVGTHNIVATFLGTGAFGDSVSSSISHVITRGQTKTNITSNQLNAIYGQAVRFTITVSAQAPALGQPAGSVAVLADGVPLGTVPIVSGTATFETAAFHAGMKSITATYSGDANFEGSTSSAIQQNISKAQTQVDARSRSALVGESPVITVFVNVIPGSALVPSGTVSISEGGAVLGTQPLNGGAANVSLNPLTVGDHTLIVNYSGDTDFEASSETIVQPVGAPGLSIHGTRVLEGNRGITDVSLVVSLSAPVSQTVRVSFSTVAGSATAGEDYESASGVIEFAPGEMTHSIELHVIGDTFPESDETFSVLLSNPVNATIDTPSAMIVIANDDQVPPRRRPSGH